MIAPPLFAASLAAWLAATPPGDAATEAGAPIASLTAAPLAAPLLLDALCDEPAWRAAPRTALATGIELRALADAAAVYFCVTATAESYNTVDVYLAPADGRLYNLHASAQVGERVRGAAGWGEYTWWNHRGWYSPAVPFTGLVGEGEDRRANFMTGRAREIQILKSRFAPPWRVMFDAGGTANADGEWRRSRWPTGADDAKPETWATFAP